jgi:hypothetical protein
MFIILYRSKLRYHFFGPFFTFVLNKTETANVIAYGIVMKKNTGSQTRTKKSSPTKKHDLVRRGFW